MANRKSDDAGSKQLEDEVDRNLKRVYDDMIEDDVPERFAVLLQKLRNQDAGK